MNRIGFTDAGLENLLYDLQQMHQISDVEIAEGISSNVIQLIPEQPEFVLANLTKEQLAKYAEDEGFTLAKNLTKPKMIASIELQQKAKLEASLQEDTIDDNANTDAPNFAKFLVDGIEEDFKPVREEFPFLNEEDCPEVFFIVVGKKITAYKKWQDAQQQLSAIEQEPQTATPEEVKELAIIAETNFRENQALYDELNHYNLNGEILGKHSLFRENVAKREVESMTTAQLSKYRNSSAKYFTDKKNLLIKHADNAEKVAEINQQVEDRKYKLSLVNAKLGINDEQK